MYARTARVVAGAGAALALSIAAATAAPVAPGGHGYSASRSATKAAAFAPIPELCGGFLTEATSTQMVFTSIEQSLAIEQQGLTASFGSSGVQPRLVTRVGYVGDSQFFLAVLPDGSLWSAEYPLSGGPMRLTQLRSSGYAGVKAMAGTGMGNVYMVWSTGAFVRYTATRSSISGTTVLASRGWAGLTTLDGAGRGSYAGKPVDAFLAVTSTGALNEYLVGSDGWMRGATLKASGWGGMKAVVAGGCSESNALTRPLYAVTKAGSVYSYKDANGYDLSGADLSSSGLVKTSPMTGVVF